MPDDHEPRKRFRWGRFALTFLIVLALAECGGRGDRAPEDPSLRITYEIGRVFGALVLSLLIYGIDSLILRRRRKTGSQAREPGSEH